MSIVQEMIHNVNVSSNNESFESRPRRRRTRSSSKSSRATGGRNTSTHSASHAADNARHSQSNRNRGSQSSPLMAPEAVERARWALEEFGEGDIGEHIGITGISADSATHRFAADVPGYSGWEWHAVVACPPGETEVTVSELALVPAAQALQAPEWVPWSDRIQPGDLGPGDLMPPEPNDPRLNGDELSDLGLEESLQRWRTGEYGPNSKMAEKAPLQCTTCAFFLPWDRGFGVCANEYSADGRVVHSRYGCGAHSRTRVVDTESLPQHRPFDDEGPIF